MKRFTAVFLSVIVMLICALPVSAEGGISARAYVLMDALTGRVVSSSNGNIRLPMASTTKVMTTLLTLESGGLDEAFEVDSMALLTEGSSMCLQSGDIVSKRDLCCGMLLPSGNDAANAAALKLAGDYVSFAEKMNARAKEIGMTNTRFVTPSGLHDTNHYSSAFDMALLTREALQNKDFREICGQEYIHIHRDETDRDYYLYNSNKMLSKYEGCIGVKTGFTDEAGRCLISAAEKNGVTLICVTLNAPDDWNDHRKLLDSGFAAVKAVEQTDLCGKISINVAGGTVASISAIPCRRPVCTSINGEIPDIRAEYVCRRFLYAPVVSGTAAGMMNIYADGVLIDRIELVAAESCGYKNVEIEVSLHDRIIDYLKQHLTKRG